MKAKLKLMLGIGLLVGSSITQATPFSMWADNGWTQIASEDGLSSALGGQPFDTEYMYYQVNGTELSIGIQTGYDVIDGHI